MHGRCRQCWGLRKCTCKPADPFAAPRLCALCCPRSQAPLFWGGDITVRVTASIKLGPVVLDIPLRVCNVQASWRRGGGLGLPARGQPGAGPASCSCCCACCAC